jgi:predicted nicotinamide N-methyase
LELGTGVGIVGIAALKYTKCSSVVLSDYKEEILNNAIENSKKNGVYKENTTKRLLLDWKEYAKLEKKYDVIVGSDVIYAGAPVAELAKLLDKALNKEGKAYILIPK